MVGLFLDVKGGFANSVFKIVYTPLIGFLCNSVVHQVWRRVLDALQFFYEQCPFLFFFSNKVSPLSYLMLVLKRLLVWIPGRWTTYRTSNPKAQVLLLEG